MNVVLRRFLAFCAESIEVVQYQKREK